jgi:hypothetical protein
MAARCFVSRVPRSGILSGGIPRQTEIMVGVQAHEHNAPVPDEAFDKNYGGYITLRAPLVARIARARHRPPPASASRTCWLQPLRHEGQPGCHRVFRNLSHYGLPGRMRKCAFPALSSGLAFGCGARACSMPVAALSSAGPSVFPLLCRHG